MMAVLRQRNFALLWIGALVSRLGDFVLLVALPFYVYAISGSALATGVMFVAETVPAIVLGSIAGVYVDRWDYRRTLIVCDVCRAGTLLALFATRTPEWLWVIYPVAFIQSALAQFFTPASGTLLPQVVGEEHLMEANSVNAITASATRLVGPALGGLVLAALGLTGVVIIDAASFLFSAAAIGLVAIPLHRSKSHARSSTLRLSVAGRWHAFWREWLSGLGLIKTQRGVAALFAVLAAISLSQGLTDVLIAPFVKQVLGGDALVLGWLGTAQGVGGILGGFTTGKLKTWIAPRWLIFVGGLLVGLIILAQVNSRLLALILVLGAVGGVPLMAFNISMATLLQTSVDDAYRGRILGAYGASGALLALGGMLLASLLGDHLGILPMLDMAGILWLGAGLLAWTLLPRHAPNAPPPSSSAASEAFEQFNEKTTDPSF
jgi:MFS family permease